MVHKPRAFTVIELLVVVAVIALLIAILVPVLGSARESARTLQCSNNMRELAGMVIAFSTAHDGRAPGKASPGAQWMEILNIDYLQRSKNTDYGATHLPGTTEMNKVDKLLLCPKWKNIYDTAGARTYARPYAYNWDARGGTDFTSGGGSATAFPWQGIYGKLADPKELGPTYTAYAYGARLAEFHGDQFMFIENERANDVFQTSNTPGGKVTIPSTGTPDYAGPGGAFSFRHPYYKKSNFAFFDGHTETLTPNDEIDTARRIKLGGK